MRFDLSSWLLLSGFVLFIPACGGSVTGSTSSTDGGSDEAAPTPATGGGVCCPLGSQDPCAVCGGGGGGWAATAGDCATHYGPCDGYLSLATDSHGCAYVATPGENAPGATCCGCPQPGSGECTFDAGTWTCPLPAGKLSQCPSSAVQGAACDDDGGTCFSCEQNAGTGCSCERGGDGGPSTWLCVGAEYGCH